MSGARPASTSQEPQGVWQPDLFWEVPLGLLSFAFYRLNRAVISRLYRLYLGRSQARALTWRLLDGDTLAIPISLPVLMTTGPRWNTHGFIGTLGPFPVSGTLAIRTATARASASSWTAVVYRFPDFHTCTQFSSISTDPAAQWSEIPLPAGRYTLGIRYYGLRSGARMPEVRRDGEEPLDGVPVPADSNAFYGDLASRSSTYYRALHHYIHPLLRLRSILPAALVRREFLPVGDPDTLFRYDWVSSGSRLQIRLRPERLEDHWIFLTVYNRASLPVLSEEITSAEWCSPPLTVDGFYLFRIRPRQAGVQPFEEDDLQVLHTSTAPAASVTEAEQP